MGRLSNLTPLLAAHVAQGRLGMHDAESTDVTATNVPMSEESSGSSKSTCLWCDGAPPTESHSCHNAHRKEKKCPELDDAFSREDYAAFDKLCKPYKENTWYNNLLNCAVRRVAIIAKHTVAHIEAEDSDALLNYLLKMGDIAVDFDEIPAIPAPKPDVARAAGVCLHKLWWTMMRSHERVYNASLRQLVRKGEGRDFEGPWGWRDGTCGSGTGGEQALLEQPSAVKTTQYAMGRAMFANYLRHASAIGDKYYVYPFVNFFRMFSHLQIVFKQLEYGGTDSRLGAISNKHKIESQHGKSAKFEFKANMIPTLDEIEIRSPGEGYCFVATLMDVSSPYMMRSIGGIDQFMETKAPKGAQEAGQGPSNKCYQSPSMIEQGTP